MAETIARERVRISERDIEDYRRDGVVCLRGQFARDWVERLRAALRPGGYLVVGKGEARPARTEGFSPRGALVYVREG